MNQEQQKRAVVLLRAASAIVSKSEEAKETLAVWDNAQCDGACLIDDIAALLEDINRSKEGRDNG